MLYAAMRACVCVCVRVYQSCNTLSDIDLSGGCLIRRVCLFVCLFPVIFPAPTSQISPWCLVRRETHSCYTRALSRRVTSDPWWRPLVSGSSVSPAGADGDRGSERGRSRMLPGGGAEALQHTLSLLERTSELWAIGGERKKKKKRGREIFTDKITAMWTITSGEESWKRKRGY